MQVILDTERATTTEYTALIALLVSLGGEASISPPVTFTAAQAPSPAAFVPEAPVQAAEAESDKLIEAAASKAAHDAAGAPDVDSAGIPWDARIHSESRATVADGTWRKRRNLDETLYANVMAELKGETSADVLPPPPPAAAAGNVPPPPPPSAPTEAAPSAPTPAESAPVATSGQFANFPEFVSAVSKFGKPYAELNELAAMFGAAMFKDMNAKPDQWDAFYSMLG